MPDQLGSRRRFQGSRVSPMRKRSISRAASRPSLIAHTTSDWPRRQSPRGEYTLNACLVLAVLRRVVGALVILDTQRVRDLVFRPKKTHGEEHEICLPLPLAPRDFVEAPVLELDVHSMDSAQRPAAVGDERLGGNGEYAGIASELPRTLFMPIVDAKNARPGRPRIVRRAFVGGLPKELEIGKTATGLAQRGADTVRSCITATYDDDILVLGIQAWSLAREQGLRAVGEKLHREMNPWETPAIDRQIPWHRGTGREQQRVRCRP